MLSEEIMVMILMQGGVSALYLGGVLYWLGSKFERCLEQNTKALGEVCEVMRKCRK